MSVCTAIRGVGVSVDTEGNLVRVKLRKEATSSLLLLYTASSQGEIDSPKNKLYTVEKVYTKKIRRRRKECLEYTPKESRNLEKLCACACEEYTY